MIEPCTPPKLTPARSRAARERVAHSCPPTRARPLVPAAAQEREFHHYGSTLNGVAVLDVSQNYRQVAYPRAIIINGQRGATTPVLGHS